MEGCHDHQIGHLGKDKALELLRDKFYWLVMQDNFIFYINGCPRYLRRNTHHDIALLCYPQKGGHIWPTVCFLMCGELSPPIIEF